MPRLPFLHRRVVGSIARRFASSDQAKLLPERLPA
jgi:hypothetical protein